jgi:hypothetical protein
MDKTGKYDKDKTLLPNGKQADYRDPKRILFHPTLTNQWGKLQDKLIDTIFKEYKVNGLYWDEFPNSAARWHYGSPWDGMSGAIDPATHKLSRQRSSIELLSLPWRLKTVRQLGEAGKRLIVNGGGPASNSMLQLFLKYKFMGFVETASKAKVVTTHLYTPIGLGDHRSERSEADSYHNMVKFLEYGVLYYWYYYRVPFTYPTLTSYMFPLTPVRLGKGYILGRERIIIAKSGYYSFGGMEIAEGHFFDQNGREVKRKLETLVKNGKKYYKIVLTKNESCALVKIKGK